MKIIKEHIIRQKFEKTSDLIKDLEKIDLYAIEFNESFKQDVDPIDAMDIGLMRIIKDYLKKQYPMANIENWPNSSLFHACVTLGKIEFANYFLDKGIVDIHNNAESALRLAVYNSQYEMALNLIDKGANLKKAIEYSTKNGENITRFNFEHLKSLLKNNKKIEEEFKKESDPIKDMRIGLLHNIYKGLKKLKSTFGVEFVSLEKYFPDVWTIEIRYNNPNDKRKIINDVKKILEEEFFEDIGIKSYGQYGKVICVAIIKKEYQEIFDKVLNDAGNIKEF